MKLIALSALISTAFLAAQAPETPASFQGSLDLLFQRNDLASHPSQFQHSLALFGSWGPWSLSTTLRGTNFFRQQPNLTLASADVSLYRKNLRYQSDGLTVQAGDFYALLGQGMVLSILPNDKALRERTVEGAEVRWITERFEVRALEGTVATEVGDQSWKVKGAEVAYEFLQGQRLGLRGSAIQDTKSFLKLGERNTVSASLGGMNLPGGWGYYVEAGRLDFKKPGLEDGDALYANLTLRQRGFFGMLEHKRYKKFDNELNNPPLADRDDEVLNLGDSETTRLSLSYTLPGTALTLLAQGGPTREGILSGNLIYGGFAAEDLFDRLSLGFTFGQKQLAFPLKKTDANLAYRFKGPWSMEWILRDKRFDSMGSRFHEKDQTFQLSRAGWGSLFLLRQASEARVFDANRVFSGGLRLDLWEGAHLEISGGKLRGGEVCSGGQCIFMPPFKGWKAVAHLPFRLSRRRAVHR